MASHVGHRLAIQSAAARQAGTEGVREPRLPWRGTGTRLRQRPADVLQIRMGVAELD